MKPDNWTDRLPTSRRKLLKTTGSGIMGTKLLKSQNNPSSQNAKEYWKKITNANCGYSKSGIKEYHAKTGDMGEDRTVLVIDSGFETDHFLYNPVLEEESHKPYHVNIHDKLGSSAIDDKDETRHGTGVLGVVWQAAPNARFHIASVDSDFEVKNVSLDFLRHNLVKALRQAKRSPVDYDVIVTSMGVIEEDINVNAEDIIDNTRNITNDLADSSTVFVAAAGNREEGSQVPELPSTAYKAISVSSTRCSGKISRKWSPAKPLGQKPDIAAPGVRTGPNNGLHTIGNEMTTSVNGNNYGFSALKGSSAAAPHVAGIALLLLKHGSAAEVETALIDTAKNIEGTELDGAGRVSMMDAYRRLTDEEPGGQLTAPFTEEFENNLNGWTVDLHEDADANVSKGEGSWSERYGGSVRLDVNGGPNHIGVYHPVGSLQEGTEIVANYESPNLDGSPGGPRIILHEPDGTTHGLDIDKGGQGEADGRLSGTVPRDMPEGTELEVRLGVWPGEITVFVESISVGG